MMQSYCTGVQHVGIPCKDVDAAADFYQSLGFTVCLRTQANGNPVAFLALGNLTVELYFQPHPALQAGAIDHFSIDTTDVEACYALATAHGLHILTKGIQFLPFWEHGIRYFTMAGPNGEQIEFSQKL